jgi:hypothetical protein
MTCNFFQVASGGPAGVALHYRVAAGALLALLGSFEDGDTTRHHAAADWLRKQLEDSRESRVGSCPSGKPA